MSHSNKTKKEGKKKHPYSNITVGPHKGRLEALLDKKFASKTLNSSIVKITIFETNNRIQILKIMQRFRSMWCTNYQVTWLAIRSLINHENSWERN